LWEYRVIEKLLASEFAEIILLIKKEEKPGSFINKNHSLIYRFHEKLDRHLFRNEFDYDERINVLDLLKEIPLISYNSVEGNSSDDSDKEIFGKIKEYKTDVILNFGNVSFNDDLINVPRYGIWSYSAEDKRIIGSDNYIYWAIVRKLPEIGCTVRMSKADLNDETVIYRTSISTFTKSININKNRIYGLASLVIPRLIKGLYLFEDSYMEKSLVKFNSDIEIFSTKLHNYPNSFRALWNLILILTTHFYRGILYKKEVFWDLYFKISESEKPFPVALDSFRKMDSPKGKFWADPFVVNENESHYIFVEEYLFKTGKAHISVLKLDNKGILLSNERIIERPYHMSYPFIFELNDSYYMIPESKGDRTIQLYRCTSFPNKWEFVMNLLENISATDSTLFFYKNKWWLFTAIDELNNPSIPFSELFLYFSDDLFSGHWQSHPMNPIITDIKTSRPAGKIFILNNNLYRPSQDCSGGYGKAFNLNQITNLSESTYEEILILKVEPNWDRKLIGTHTFNFDDNITVIDASPRRKRIQLRLLKN
jgi:hypothetical protein